MTTEAYDVIIIGSGIAGLYAALQLQRRGRRILLVEKEGVIGGRTSTFKQKINGLDLQWEAGAGRISENHTMVRALIRKYGLTWIPIKGHPSFIEDYGSQPEDAPFEHGFPVFFHPVAALPAEDLATHTLRELLTRVHGPKVTDEYLLRYPYRGEVDTLRADMALELFRHEMSLTERYGICAEGYSAIVEAMHKEFESKGGATLMKHLCVEVQGGLKAPVTVSLSKEGEPVILTCRHCILAVPAAVLKSIKPMSRWKGLGRVQMRPLLRMYGTFPLEDGKLWTEEVGRIVTPQPIRYMIPGNPAIGSVQISYTDSQDAEYWKKKLDAVGERKVAEEVVDELRRLIKPTIPGPTFVKSHFWEHGVTYWLPGKYDPRAVSREAYHPLPELPNVHICGESFSLRQAWVEGALEHSAGLVRTLDKKLSHR